MPFDQTNFIEAPVSRVVRILQVARAKIEDPANWRKDEFEKEGRYCAVGAVISVSGWGDCSAWRALDAVCELQCTPWFNDQPTTTHADVLALFDRAIAAAEAQS